MSHTHAAVGVEATEQLDNVDVVFLAVLPHGIHRVLHDAVALQSTLSVRVRVTMATHEVWVNFVKFCQLLFEPLAVQILLKNRRVFRKHCIFSNSLRNVTPKSCNCTPKKPRIIIAIA